MNAKELENALLLELSPISIETYRQLRSAVAFSTKLHCQPGRLQNVAALEANLTQALDLAKMDIRDTDIIMAAVLLGIPDSFSSFYSKDEREGRRELLSHIVCAYGASVGEIVEGASSSTRLSDYRKNTGHELSQGWKVYLVKVFEFMAKVSALKWDSDLERCSVGSAKKYYSVVNLYREYLQRYREEITSAGEDLTYLGLRSKLFVLEDKLSLIVATA